MKKKQQNKFHIFGGGIAGTKNEFFETKCRKITKKRKHLYSKKYKIPTLRSKKRKTKTRKVLPYPSFSYPRRSKRINIFGGGIVGGKKDFFETKCRKMKRHVKKIKGGNTKEQKLRMVKLSIPDHIKVKLNLINEDNEPVFIRKNLDNNFKDIIGIIFENKDGEKKNNDVCMGEVKTFLDAYIRFSGLDKKDHTDTVELFGICEKHFDAPEEELTNFPSQDMEQPPNSYLKSSVSLDEASQEQSAKKLTQPGMNCNPPTVSDDHINVLIFCHPYKMVGTINPFVFTRNDDQSHPHFICDTAKEESSSWYKVAQKLKTDFPTENKKTEIRTVDTNQGKFNTADCHYSGFSPSYIYTNKTSYDAIFIPDCGGDWDDYLSNIHKKTGLLIDNIIIFIVEIYKTLIMLKENGVCIVSKFPGNIDKVPDIIGQYFSEICNFEVSVLRNNTSTTVKDGNPCIYIKINKPVEIVFNDISSTVTSKKKDIINFIQKHLHDTGIHIMF